MPAKRTRHASLSTEAIELVAACFRTLGVPIRIRILQALRDGDLNVNELATATGSSQPSVSKHVRILQSAGLLARRQNGNNVYYSIADPAVFELCDTVCGSIGARMAQHASVANELRRQAQRR